MTRDEVRTKIQELVAVQQASPYSIQLANAKDLQTALSLTSLEVVSLQLAMEDAFALKFATGAADRGPIDEAWDACKSIEDLVELVLKFRC